MLPDRVLVGSTPTLSASFFDDDGPQDVGAVTVRVTRRSDGTDVLPAGTPADKVADPVRYTVDLPAAGAVRLDELTATWTAASGRSITTVVEVVGGFLFEIHELRAEPDVGNAAKYPNEALRQVRTIVEDLFESYCHTTFVPRFSADPVTVVGAYARGMDRPPADVHDAALMYARHRLIDKSNRKLSNVRSRIGDGGDVELLSTPDPDRGRPTGLLDVDAVLNRYRDNRPAIA